MEGDGLARGLSAADNLGLALIKRKGPRRRFGSSLMIPLLALLLQLSCAAGEETDPEQVTISAPTSRGDFVVRVFAVQHDEVEEFIADTRECSVPVWQQLRSAGVVSRIDVFELSEMESTFPVKPPWRYLLIAELAPRGTADDLLAAESSSGCQVETEERAFTIVREEHMTCTPNSCFAMPEPSYHDAASGIDYLIDFIAAENAPPSLAKYRDLMSRYFGPANGLLVDRGLLHCFMALEMTGTLFETPEVVTWNQVHLSDHWDESGDVDWDTVYEDLFRAEFSRELDDVWAEIPSIREISIEYRGRLVRDLCVR
jgi:hypothetical protein